MAGGGVNWFRIEDPKVTNAHTLLQLFNSGASSYSVCVLIGDYVHAKLFTVAFFLIVKDQKQPECPSVEDQPWCIDKVENYAVVDFYGKTNLELKDEI